ncbi:galactokinase [Methanobrevibacter cuticularis]|uniref:Mevalonate kinase n=1 Tax=Methanobrevibacter cuticularis TaxID=47311 RepID=A0A166FJC5_9EURY|nr:mevalonate kinase [Methanobrevibacter cuticularis]KZX17735.1 galactokinase [Methanobrevibacter cuticularis]
MESIASAPGKMILFGEHAVVYGEPAIAGAVNKRVTIKITKSSTNSSIFKSDDLGFEAELNTRNKRYISNRGKPGIIKYILEILFRFHDHSPIVIDLSLDIPIGSGLGSSAAVTVSTLAALFNYHGKKFNKNYLAKKAHEIESSVQGIASPLDTSVSTFGGLIYLSREKKIFKFTNKLQSSFVIGYTLKRGNTGKMVKSVRSLKNRYSKIVDPIITSIGEITDEAKFAIAHNNQSKFGELMNINQGLLDSLGVNTKELSRMVYIARKAGAHGSKITGSGGGGSIIAFCPTNEEKVFRSISKYDNALKVRFSNEGVIVQNRKIL